MSFPIGHGIFGLTSIERGAIAIPRKALRSIEQLRELAEGLNKVPAEMKEGR